MPNATIYIKPENWEFWQRVVNKSELVNAVIEQGEELALTFPDKLAKKIILEKPVNSHYSLEGSSMVEQVSVKDKVVGSTPTPPARNTIGKIRGNDIYCKEGHALDSNGRCFGKACKYN